MKLILLMLVALVLGVDSSFTLIAYLIFGEPWLLKVGLVKAIAFGLCLLLLAGIELVSNKGRR